jgi:hypothetical protein
MHTAGRSTTPAPGPAQRQSRITWQSYSRHDSQGTGRNDSEPTIRMAIRVRGGQAANFGPRPGTTWGAQHGPPLLVDDAPNLFLKHAFPPVRPDSTDLRLLVRPS